MTTETRTCDLCGREIGLHDDRLCLTVREGPGGLPLDYLWPSGMPHSVRVPHDGHGNLDLCFACKGKLEDTLHQLMTDKKHGNDGLRGRRQPDTRQKVYEGYGPNGRMETTAVSMKKAESNFRARLHFEYGLSWYAARHYDLSPIREVKR